MASKESTARASVIALSAMRIGIGALAWARPATTAQLFGIRAWVTFGLGIWLLGNGLR